MFTMKPRRKQRLEAVDILQIPAFLCRQTDLIDTAVSTGQSGESEKRPVPLARRNGTGWRKKQKSLEAKRILLTERGTTFGYQNLVADMRSIPIMKSFGFPIIFDATHSVQLPGGGGDKSSGQREFAPVSSRLQPWPPEPAGSSLKRTRNPDQALSDGPNMIPLVRDGDGSKKVAENFRSGEIGPIRRDAQSDVNNVQNPLSNRLKRIKLLLCDVDGVLTDGSVFIGGPQEFKRFNIRDGLGIVLARRAGFESGLGLRAPVGGDHVASGGVEN
jgi:hypothetical protein